MKKLIFFAFLIGMTSCGTSPSGKRSAKNKTQELNKFASYNFYIDVNNALEPLILSVEEYNAIHQLKMDSLKVTKLSYGKYWSKAQENDFLKSYDGIDYFVVPVSKIAVIKE